MQCGIMYIRVSFQKLSMITIILFNPYNHPWIYKSFWSQVLCFNPFFSSHNKKIKARRSKLSKIPEGLLWWPQRGFCKGMKGAVMWSPLSPGVKLCPLWLWECCPTTTPSRNSSFKCFQCGRKPAFHPTQKYNGFQIRLWSIRMWHSGVTGGIGNRGGSQMDV